MNIRPLTKLEQRAREAYEDWVDIGNNRYGSIHLEAFMAAFALGAAYAVGEVESALDAPKGDLP